MSKREFTTDVLDWAAWIAPVDLASASPDQLAVLEERGPHAQKSQYYHLLLHDAPALRERSLLFNSIMYRSEGLPRAERELGATVESIVNGCVYCTSVHARFYIQLAKRPDVIERLFAEGVGADLTPRERAIANFSAKLALTPPQAGPTEIRALRNQGLSDSEIADLALAVAMFAWANRLMLTLGEPKKAEWL
jgi:alkylhydroperoxidase domain protein